MCISEPSQNVRGFSADAHYLVEEADKSDYLTALLATAAPSYSTHIPQLLFFALRICPFHRGRLGVALDITCRQGWS